MTFRTGEWWTFCSQPSAMQQSPAIYLHNGLNLSRYNDFCRARTSLAGIMSRWEKNVGRGSSWTSCMVLDPTGFCLAQTVVQACEKVTLISELCMVCLREKEQTKPPFYSGSLALSHFQTIFYSKRTACGIEKRILASNALHLFFQTIKVISKYRTLWARFKNVMNCDEVLVNN